jgi:hypothetical protein
VKQKLFKTNDVRIHQQTDGLHVIAEQDRKAFIGAFRVTLLAGLNVRVGLGNVDGIIPVISGIGLDGKDKGGIVRSVPPLPLTGGPNSDLRSWVGLQLQIDLATGKPDPKQFGNATLLHFNNLASYWSNGLSKDDGKGNGVLPLAMIVWRSASSVQTIVQNVYFNQHHSYKAATANAKGWHFFYPAS